MAYVIEIATTDLETTRAAVAGGADRIELCAALTEGGTTPSLGTIHECRRLFNVQLFPIIRPRSGDFLYSNDEFNTMLHDIQICKNLGCDGVVIGLLLEDGSIDVERTRRLADLAYPMDVTFHRAFDRCRDPLLALEQLIDCGCQRILTSGQQLTAPEGAELITQLVRKAEERIIIMPGSGIRENNIAALAKKTGASEWHSSLRGQKASRMSFIPPAFAGRAESCTNPDIDPAAVRRLREALTSQS